MRQFICVLLISFLCISANNPKERSVKPIKLTQLNGTVINLSTLKLKDKKDTTIRFVNDTTINFTLIDYQTSCGCTKLTYNKRPIKPSAVDSIKISFNAKDAGAFYKKIILVNNINPKGITLSIKGSVENK